MEHDSAEDEKTALRNGYFGDITHRRSLNTLYDGLSYRDGGMGMSGEMEDTEQL